MGEELPNYLSLGAGVQSSTLALMAATGEITPMPKAAIFADTQAEPAGVYGWLDWLETQLPFPVLRVTAGDLRKAALTPHVSAKGVTYCRTALPFHTRSSEGEAGRIRLRTCTRDYKIRPIMKAVRRLAGVKRGATSPALVQWIGISLDEVRRVKPAREPWVATRWPLIEKRMTRLSCLGWLRANGFPEPPRSACVFCPFRSDAEWRRLRDHDPDGFADAVEFDREARALRESTTMKSEVFVHRSLVPLDQADIRSDRERGQRSFWDDECFGMCGV